MLRIEERSRVLHELATEAVPDTVDLWPVLNSRLLPARRREDEARTWRWAGFVAAAVVLAGVIGLGLVPTLSTPDAVSAETILDRAEVAATTTGGVVSTYHLLMTRVGKDAGSMRSEVWFDGPDRQRTIQQVIGANGAVVSRQDVVFNGPETWIEDTQNGATRVIHTIGGPVIVRGDPHRLHQVLLNLTMNAVQHAPAGVGEVVLTFEAPASGRVRTIVSDNGPGVDPERARHLFDRF